MPSSRWTPKTAILYSWHLIDGLTHVLFESTYIYGCFAYSVPLNSLSLQRCTTSLNATRAQFFLGQEDRLYGNIYGSSIFAKLWQQYALVDSRYSGVDITTLSLEIVTVLLAGPLALYVSELIRRNVSAGRGLSGQTWFWAGVLAVGELYGGLLNFLPEWLTNNASLRTEEPLYFWVYIVFFNAVWIVLPLWVLQQVCSKFTSAFDATKLDVKKLEEIAARDRESGSRKQKDIL